MFKTLTLLFAMVFGVIAYAQNISVNSTPPTHTSGQMVLPFAPNSTTITESNDPVTITAGNSVSCNGGAPNYYNTDNSYFRAFTLSNFGIVGDFTVTSVQVGIEQATASSGTQAITCNLYTSSQNFPSGYPGSLTMIGTSTENIPDQNLTLYNFNVTGVAPAGSQLVVEINSPDGQTLLNTFFIGSNASGETAPSYLLAADCSITTPTTTTTIGFPGMNIVMSVTGDDNLPVELSSFNAVNNYGNVNLTWTTSTETNNRGFEIEKSTGGNYFTIGFIKGQGTTTQLHSYSFMDQNVPSGMTSYRLKQLDFSGAFTFSDVVTLNVDAPATYQLTQNYPNPFNPTTQISFAIPVDAGVKITIYNSLGQEVTRLVNNDFTAGNHDVNFNAANLSSGLYFYVLQANGVDGSSFTSTKKMMLLK